MEVPNLIEKPAIILVGIVGCGHDVTQIDISGLWQRFTQQENKIKHVKGEVGYELHIEEETQPRMHFCLVGLEVSETNDLPSEFFIKVLPPCKYAVFTHHFRDGDYSYAFTAAYRWLDQSDFEAAYPYDIQTYDERFKGADDPDSVIEIFIPVVARSLQPGLN